MNELFQIGSFPFRLIYPDQLRIPENLRRFQIENQDHFHHQNGSQIYTYRIRLADRLAIPETKPLFSRPEIAVYDTPQGEIRLLAVANARQTDCYARYEETADDSAEITVNSQFLHLSTLDTMFTSLLALERRMLALDSMVLHCAYIEYKGEAILFSAPSQTGKSTQASLWEQYRGARTINGDRGLLEKKDGRWYAQGWPVCGTSGICHNHALPIRAIVMLSQGKTDQIQRLTPAQAFAQIYGQITINRWNRQACEQAMDLLEHLICEVPIWHLSCTISEEAVNCLENALFSQK